MKRLRDELVKPGSVRRDGDLARARPSSASTACRPSRTASSARRPTEVEATFNRESGAGGTYTFRMKPNIVNQLRQER